MDDFTWYDASIASACDVVSVPSVYHYLPVVASWRLYLFDNQPTSTGSNEDNRGVEVSAARAFNLEALDQVSCGTANAGETWIPKGINVGIPQVFVEEVHQP